MNSDRTPNTTHTIVSSRRKKQTESDIESRLQESEERYRVMFEHAAVGMAHVGLDGRWLYVNQKLCDITGYTQEELRAKTFQEMTYPEDLATDLEHMQRMLNGELQTYTIEKRYYRKDHTLIWINLTVSMVRDGTGRMLYFITIIEDISERKRVEKKFVEQATQLSAILDSLADAMFVYDRDGHVLFASTAAQDILPFEVQPDRSVSSNDLQMVQATARDEFGEPLPVAQLPLQRILRGEVLRGASIVEVMVRGRRGHDILLSVSGAPMRDSAGDITGAVLVARDVTKGRGLERRTHVALEGLLSMAEALVSMPEDNIYAHSLGEQIVELTRAVLNCQRVSMYLVDAATAAFYPFAVIGLSPEQENAWWEQERQRTIDLHNYPVPALIERLRHNEVLMLDMSQPPFNQYENTYDVKIMLSAPMCIGERLIGVINLDYGGAHHPYTENEIALASAVAKLSALVIERQRLLTERAEAQGREMALREANQRMEEFLGLASHELRTPLTTIKANIQLAMRRLKSVVQQETTQPAELVNKVDAALNMLIRAERQVSVLNRLVSDMVDISRIHSGRLQLQVRQEPSDLASIVREVVQERQKMQPARTINVFIPVDTPVPVLADPDRIAQVINNYLSNALKYSAADQPVDVIVTVEEADVHVAVRDYGQGLSKEDQRMVWECFYQSPKVKVLSGSGVGLGLGLYLNQTLIERHQGHAGVESTPGEGSTFWFTLPLAPTRSSTGVGNV